VGRDRIVIHDRFEGTAHTSPRVSFLLHPDAKIVADGTRATIMQGGKILHLASSEPFENEPAVWWPCMGLEFKTSRLLLWIRPPNKAVTTELTWERVE
jgi:hypothetical protein